MTIISPSVHPQSLSVLHACALSQVCVLRDGSWSDIYEACLAGYFAAGFDASVGSYGLTKWTDGQTGAGGTSAEKGHKAAARRSICTFLQFHYIKLSSNGSPVRLSPVWSCCGDEAGRQGEEVTAVQLGMWPLWRQLEEVEFQMPPLILVRLTTSISLIPPLSPFSSRQPRGEISTYFFPCLFACNHFLRATDRPTGRAGAAEIMAQLSGEGKESWREGVRLTFALNQLESSPDSSQIF